jgi:outer membrane protein OmpA-like peptidoglycan-associated protein/opacity protein-like surface antigen
MKMKLKRTLALAALLTGVAGVAHAENGWYVRADVGESVDASLDGHISSTSFNPDVDNGWVGDAGVGYSWDSGFRLEGELGYLNNKWEDDSGRLPFTGNINTWAVMGNFFYDFNRHGSIRPYIGLGAGEARGRLGEDGVGHDTDWQFAYQGMVGVGFQISDHATIDVGYRYFRADGFNTPDAFGATHTDIDYVNQSVMVGLRYQFFNPPPPPPPPVAPPPVPPPVVAPPPAACPEGDYVVYFEWDRSNLNQAALETIDAAVAHARDCNIAGVVVAGHTDTSGSAQYNMGLSERRASVVRDALVARGIAAGSITTNALGETDLARQTRDGVREPLNRRSTITISFR